MATVKINEVDIPESANLEKYCKSLISSNFPTDSEDLIDPYEKKYYALLRRCNNIQQSNEKLVNRIHHVKKLLRQVRKEKKALMKRLDHYNDEYRKVPIEMLLEESPSPVPPAPAPVVTQSSPRPSSVVKKKIKQEKDKDPNAPKRPANPFFLFCQEQRSTILERFQQEAREDISHPELTKTLAKNWNNLSPDDKKVYYDLYEREKERYEQEMRIYTGKENPLGGDTG